MGDDEKFPADEDPTNTQSWGLPVVTPSGTIAYQGQNFIGGSGASVIWDAEGNVSSFTQQGIPQPIRSMGRSRSSPVMETTEAASSRRRPTTRTRTSDPPEVTPRPS